MSSLPSIPRPFKKHEDEGWQLLERQKQEMDEQDKALDLLSDSIFRQKNMALTIGKQVDQSIVLIDDIEKGTQHVNSRVERTTHHVEQFDDKHSTRFLWCIIFILVLALIIVAGLALYT